MCSSLERNHCQYVMYLLSSRIHFPSSFRSSFLLSWHKVLIDFIHVLHSAVAAYFFLGQLKSWIRLKLVDLYVADCLIWVPWWLLISLMKKTPLDMRHQLMAHSYEVVKSRSDNRSVIIQASCMQCVDTYSTRWEMMIWFADMNLHISSIQDSVCSHCWVSM